MSRSNLAFAFTILMLVLTPTRAPADLVVSATDVNLTPGGTGTIDFTITSDASDTLSAFGLELLITPVGNPASLLQFTTAQPNPYGNTSYVFAGASFGSDNGLPFWGPPSPAGTNYPYDTISGGDSDDSNQGYVTLSATASYLAAVQFKAPQGAKLGDQFQISLVNNPSFTYFDDQNGDPITQFTYASGGGMVTIAPATVPEPSSSSMAAIASLSGLLSYWRNRRRLGSPLRLS